MITYGGPHYHYDRLGALSTASSNPHQSVYHPTTRADFVSGREVVEGIGELRRDLIITQLGVSTYAEIAILCLGPRSSY